MNQLPLQSSHYYHIFNRANGKSNLFNDEADFAFFMQLYEKYIPPIADTFAWILMPNHFHTLVWIKESVYYKYSASSFTSSNIATSNALRFEDVKWQTVNLSASNGPDSVNVNLLKKPNPTKHFTHLFSSYAKYSNDKYNRTGNLFQRPFKRKLIGDEEYLKQVVVYIHNNPVHHGFTKSPNDYIWSSYLDFLIQKPTILQREMVLKWFGGIENFIAVHSKKIDRLEFEKKIGLI